jgi:methionyl-tRNA formyltransferase
MKIVFFGTPEFAVPSLEILLINGYDIVGVVTVPDKPAGRGLLPKKSDIKVFAEKNGLNILQPEFLEEPVFLKNLKILDPDLQVVVAFRKLPDSVWNKAPLGTFNLHASLLPDYRGAAPINRAIINGEKETGVTTFFLNNRIDCGDILFREKVNIDETDTAGSLHDRLAILGASLVLKTVKSIEIGHCQPFRQPESIEIKKAPKISTDDCRIDWNKSTLDIYNFIRGLNPYPTAWTTLNGKNLKVFASEMVKFPPFSPPGTIQTDFKTYLQVALIDGHLYITELQYEGRKRLSIKDFLIGISYNQPLVIK